MSQHACKRCYCGHRVGVKRANAESRARQGKGHHQGHRPWAGGKRPSHHLPYPLCISAESIPPPHGNLQGVTDGLFWYQSWITLAMEVEPLLPLGRHNAQLVSACTQHGSHAHRMQGQHLPSSAHGSAWVWFSRQVYRNGPCQSTWIPSLVSLLEIQSPMLWLLRSVNWQSWSSRPRCPTKGFSASPVSLNFSLCFLWLIPSGYDL